MFTKILLLLSLVKSQCGLCNESFYGGCVRPLDVKFGEYIGISPLTKKQTKSTNSCLSNHLLFCQHSASYFVDPWEHKVSARTERESVNNEKLTILE